VNQIKTLRNKAGKWLQVDLEAEVGTPAGERLDWLEFQLDRSPKEENQDGLLAPSYCVEAELTWVPQIERLWQNTSTQVGHRPGTKRPTIVETTGMLSQTPSPGNPNIRVLPPYLPPS